MKEMPPNDYEKNMQTQNNIRIFIVLLVVIVIIISVIVMKDQKEKMEVEYNYVDATVEWDNDTSLMIRYSNDSAYEIKVIGEDDNGRVVAEYSTSPNLTTNYTTIDIERMMNDNLKIFVEIHNLSTGYREIHEWEW